MQGETSNSSEQPGGYAPDDNGAPSEPKQSASLEQKGRDPQYREPSDLERRARMPVGDLSFAPCDCITGRPLQPRILLGNFNRALFSST
jgi:hypothetical protein